MILNTEKADISVLPVAAAIAPGELYFDIETTGFSARTSFLYLVGFMYQKEDGIYITQAFSELPTDEINVLKFFASFIGDYDTLLHFNGETFDIPFMEKKLSIAGIENSLAEMRSVDLYKHFRKLKKLIQIPSLKQKAVEQYLNIPRLDRYDGNGLIDVYQHYVGLKKKDDLALMLLHNYEDVRNMLGIKGWLKSFADLEALLSQTSFSATDKPFCPSIIEVHGQKLILTFECPDISVLSVNIEKPDELTGEMVEITVSEGSICLSLPVFEGTLKRFFSNYRDYFYLPTEGKIVHKSVGSFVDPAFREKAKPDNCFVPCEGRFVPSPKDIPLSVFLSEYRDKNCYISEQELMGKPEVSALIVKGFLFS